MYDKKAINHYQQAQTLHHQGSFSAAERAYKKALKINPDFVEALNNLANAYLDQGRYREAVMQYKNALKLLPDNSRLLNNIGNALQLQNEFDTALNWFKRAIEQDPDYANAHSNAGNAYWALGKPDSAIKAYHRAIQLNPDLAGTLTHLGGVLLETGNLKDAVFNFNRALKINPGDAKAHQGLGRVSNAQSDLEQAVSEYQKAIEIEPDNDEFHEELGKTYSDHGEIENAIACYRKAIEINPQNASAYRALSRNRKFDSRDNDIIAMESLQLNNDLSLEDKIQLSFALGKAYEDLGEYQKSFEYVTRATSLKRSSIDYSASESDEIFDQIKTFFDTAFFSSQEHSGDPDPTPIFILGMPRSGTSLVEQILASHPDVYGAGEISDLAVAIESAKAAVGTDISARFPNNIADFSSEDYAAVGKHYINSIRQYSPVARFITDKMPHNFLRIGLIKAALPNAKIIHCKRDPMDNCLSIFKTYLVSGHRYSYDLAELGQYYRLYQALMIHWHELLPGFLYDQSYEDLVADPKLQVENLLQFCDLPWHDACLEFHKTQRSIGTASSAQVRRPIYKDSVKLWKLYENQLEPLQAALYD